MSCPQHGHLPSPMRPAACPECHLSRLSDLMPSSSMAQSQASVECLSDLVGTLRIQLQDSREEARRLAAQVESLRAEVAGLKRGLTQAKRQAKEGRELLMTSIAEKHVILEAMERMTATTDCK